MSRTVVAGPRRGGLRTLLWTAAVACTLIVPTIAGAAGTQALDCFGSAATIVGTEGPDQVRGTAGNDVIVTLGGVDSVDGLLGGSDKICTGDGDDTVVAGSGNDEVDLGAGSDSVLGQLGDDNLLGGEGADLVAYITSPVGVQVNLATGTATGAGTDRLSGFERVWASAFGDVLHGDDRQNVFIPDVLQVRPAGSDDVIDGADGFDFVQFEGTVRANLGTGQATGEGNDRLTGIEGLFAGQASVFVGNGGPNVLFGGSQADVLDGGGGDDDILGNAGNDRLSGGAGLDLIDGGGGNDAIDGGAGYGDIAMYINASTRVQVSLASRRARGEGVDTLAGVETIVGSQFGDTLDGSRRADRLHGQGGNDRISGGGGDDFLDGGGARDRLGGGPDLDYCYDGERNSGCEASERSRTSSRSARRPVQGASPTGLEGTLDVLYALATGKPVRASDPTDVSGPTLGLAVTAGTDGYVYPPYPTCEGSGNRRFTKIAPPKRLPLAGRRGEQTLTWQGTLTDARGRVLFRTAVAGAVIQEDAGGHVYQWDDLRSGNPYQPRRIALAAGASAGRRWGAEIRIEGDPAPVRHDVPPPCPLVRRS